MNTPIVFPIGLSYDVNGSNNKLIDYGFSSTYVESIPAPHFK